MPSNRHSVIDSSSILQANTIPTVDKLYFYNLDNLKPSLQPVKDLKGPVGQIMQPDKTLLAVEQNKVSYNAIIIVSRLTIFASIVSCRC